MELKELVLNSGFLGTVGISFMHIALSVVILFLQGGIIAWALHKLNASQNYRGQAGVTRLTWYVFEAQLLAGLFLALSLWAVAFGLSRLQCMPFNQALTLVDVRHFWQPIYFLVTTAIQIILIKIPAHVSKRDFVLTIAAINLGIMLTGFVVHTIVDKVIAAL